MSIRFLGCLRVVIFAPAIIAFLAGCASPGTDSADRGEKSETNDGYATAYAHEVGKLNDLIIEECHYKLIERRRADTGDLYGTYSSMSGTVTYEIDTTGQVVAAAYRSRVPDGQVRRCVGRIAVGKMLPAPEAAKVVTAELAVNFAL